MYRPKSKVQMVITALLSLAFLGAGIMKLTGAEEMRQGFENWGYPIFFMYIIGICEGSGAPSACGSGASHSPPKSVSSSSWPARVLTHLAFDTIKDAVPPIVLIILTAVTLALHRRERDTNDELMPAA